MQLPVPLTRDLVLVGGGHTHALVLRKWGMRPLPGVRLTLINPGPTAPYSGMLPGFVAGHYAREDLDIDLVRLARFAGARLILGAAEELDVRAREIHVPGRPPVGYDVCSIDIGITSDMPDLPGFAEHGVPAKPLGPFSERWARYLAGEGPASVAVLGGGVAGVELAMAMAHALRSRGRSAEVTLIDAATALQAVDPGSQRVLRRAMGDLGVTLMENAPPAAILPDRVALADGREVPAGFVTGAAGARAYGWLGTSGLALQDGYVRVNAELQSSDEAVFAVGDCAHFDPDPRPKAGVYAVRQAPVLAANLVAALGGTALRPYRPQKDYLKLVSMGGKVALAQKAGLSRRGALMWRWKDRIDQKFMNRFRDLPQMEPPAPPPVHALGVDEAMGEQPLCGGCGAKVGRAPLQEALAGLPQAARTDVTTLPGDDAALLRVGNARQVLTSDHLRAFVEDPYLMARIAALHALGDIWAMGAVPQAATMTLILPRLGPRPEARTLREIVTGAGEEMTAAGSDIVGGHTSTGAELTIGFSVTGLCEADPVTLAGAQIGDELILTKPIGSGVLLAAEMAGRAEGAEVTQAWDAMLQGQGAASAILAPAAHAMTDVTGFGLAGHLHGMCTASGTGAALDLAALPLLPGALRLSEAGIRSSLYPQNRALLPDLSEEGAAALLFDPQTAGGLLAAVPAERAEGLLTDLLAAGSPSARIGTMTDQTGSITAA